MTPQTAMIGVSVFTATGALYLADVLRRLHRYNPVTRRIAFLPVAIGLQAGNVAATFILDTKTGYIPSGILTRSLDGWMLMGLVLWYLGLYFAGKVNGRRE